MAEKHGNDAHSVSAGQIIHKADQVARQGFNKTNGTAGTMDHANLRHALTGRPPVSEGLEQSEVPPMEEKDQD